MPMILADARVCLWTGPALQAKGDGEQYNDAQLRGSSQAWPLPPELPHQICLQNDSGCSPSNELMRTVKLSLYTKRSCEVSHL